MSKMTELNYHLVALTVHKNMRLDM